MHCNSYNCLQMEHYLGRGDNYWKTHGLLCSHKDDSGSGSGYDFSGGDDLRLLEMEPDRCLVFYSVVETVHASVFILLAVSCGTTLPLNSALALER